MSMPQIVCVHGIAQQLHGENTLHQLWSPALLDGLTRASYQGPEPGIAIAFFGDQFRQPGTMGVDAPRLIAADLTTQEEQDLITLWWHAAAETDSGVPPPDAQTMGRTPLLVQDALNALCQSRFFAGLSERLLIWFVKQVYLYFHDTGVRRGARERLAAKVTPD